jgi:hypothetical protein
MADFPYTQVTGKLKSLFQKIQQVGKPDTVDKKWLASIGLKSSNDPSLIPVLRVIDFIDQSNNPTERWTRYRDKSQARKVLAEGILIGYAELFQTYPDAYRRSDDELKAFFTTKTKAGSQVVSKTVTTFKNLCELADFQDVPIEGSSVQSVQLTQGDIRAPTRIIKELEAGVTININIQLTLPDTTDESVYDKLFAAMKKHLLS